MFMTGRIMHSLRCSGIFVIVRSIFHFKLLWCLVNAVMKYFIPSMYDFCTTNDKMFEILSYSYCAFVMRDNVKMTLWRGENAYDKKI